MSRSKKPTTSKKRARRTAPVTAKYQKPVIAAATVPDATAEPAAKPVAVAPVAPVQTPVPDVRPTQPSSFLSKLRNTVWSDRFAMWFALASVSVLLLTTLFWTMLAANLHQSNADQLIDSYLFEDVATLRGASFPGAHSFLVKWPLFGLMQLFGHGPTVFLVATIIIVLVTVAVLAFMLYRIERRPRLFGVVCLALSSLLLLVPAQPYPGALLPVNMAMTTTRNLEYILFVVTVYMAIRVTRLQSWRFVAVAVLSGLLIASDKLFIVLAVGGALAAVVWHIAIRRERSAVVSAARLAAASLLGIVVSAVIFALIKHSGLAGIANEQMNSPYAVVGSVRQLASGGFFGLMALLTTFGANPVHATLMTNDMPRALASAVRDPVIIAYLINGVVLGLAAWATWRTLRSRRPSDTWTQLSVILCGSTAAAMAVFILTDHYYPVDARYIAIALFAVAIAATSHLRTLYVRPRYLIAATIVLALAIPLGLRGSWQEYRASQIAMSDRTTVTTRAATALQTHKIDRLAGDYWNVTPVKTAKQDPLTIMPVDGCTTPRPLLNSSNWFRSPPGESSAYLAVRDGSPEAGPEHTDLGPGSIPTYGGCTLAKLASAYGVPSERIPVGTGVGPTGTSDALLLLYPQGFRPADTTTLPTVTTGKTNSTPAPTPPEVRTLVPFSERGSCSRGTTLQVIAHQDDDLLFMNPDVMASITEGRCLRTVYLTAGDAGADVGYWGNREKGAKAAYAEMYNTADSWLDERQVLNGRQVTVSYLKDVPTVSLIFFRLPDGSLRGEGFSAHNHESLSKLVSGQITEMHSIDSPNTYTKQNLIDSLRAVMVADLPNQIRTQSSTNQSDGDHADHHAAGTLTEAAASGYLEPHQVIHYSGYPSQYLPVNLSDADIVRKELTFLTYAKFDGAVCQTTLECQNSLTYGKYLKRKYLP